jgi:hypothetical protein
MAGRTNTPIHTVAGVDHWTPRNEAISLEIDGLLVSSFLYAD